MSKAKKDEIVTKLNETRSKLLSFFEGLGDSAWQTAVYHEDTHWTTADILRHLVDSESSMTGLMRQWQQGKDPVSPEFDLTRWNNRVIQKSAEKTPEELLVELKENRGQLLDFVETIGPEDWPKQGRHGSLRIMNIEEVCHLIADHEISHLKAIEQTQKSV